jgi:hypothetical protein
VSLVAVCALAGCGGDGGKTVTEASPGQEPGITTPNSGRQYENGGADGSGADGTESSEPRGGIAAGPDSPSPGDREGADSQFSPPRGGRLEE